MRQQSPSRDRYSASVTSRPRRRPRAVALLALAVAGVGVLQWYRAGSEPEAGRRSDSGIRILSARGGVEVRHGDQGPWREARSGDRLARGDWIKSSAEGTAEVRFPDGATYVLPPATLGRLDQLAARGARIASGEAGAGIDFQWVEIESEEAPNVSPAGPRLIDPVSDHEIDLATQKQLCLAWEEVPAASHYALNVSASRSFASNIIEDSGRRKPSARIGIRGEGVFYWRVAAVGRDGAQGAWSEVRSFRVRG